MTRREAYAEGYAEGCRWAEQDARDHAPMGRESERIRDLAANTLALRLTEAGDLDAARELGRARGYRETRARIDAGTLTRSMFELGPVNR